MGKWVFLNGGWVPYEQAVIPVEDRGFLFSDAIYEVIRCYAGRPFCFDEHIYRLFRSARSLNLTVPYDKDQWREITQELLARNEVADAAIYLQVSRGAAPRSHTYGPDMKPTVFAIARAVVPPGRELVTQGVACATMPDTRWGLCHIKTTGLLPNVLARHQAQDSGFYDAIFVRDGFITEATSSNVFALLDGEVWTYPLANILPGVTRDVVLRLLRQKGIPVREEGLPLDRFRQAEEIWLTSTIIEVLPVTNLDGRPVGPGQPGPMVKDLRAAFAAAVAAGG